MVAFLIVVAAALAFGSAGAFASHANAEGSTLAFFAVGLFVAAIIRANEDAQKRKPTAAAKAAATPAKATSQVSAAGSAAVENPIITIKPTAFDVLLSYVDSHHHATKRQVTVHRLTGTETASGEVELEKLFGWCHLHRGNRTFRLDRIEDLADPNTGEIIVNHTAYLLARAGHRRPTATTISNNVT